MNDCGIGRVSSTVRIAPVVSGSATPPLSYEVQSGDTLSSIFSRHGFGPSTLQAVLAAEVVVHGARRAIRTLGDGIDRRALHAALGEQLGGGRQQPGTRVGPPLPLCGHGRNLGRSMYIGQPM